MKTFYIPATWLSQWHKPMISLFDYVPTRYEASEREKQIRSLIWDFKAGKRSKQVAAIVANKIAEKFGSFADSIVFVCVPASSVERTERRYREFCEEVARRCGCMNGYNAIKVDGSRMTIHETKKGKSLQNSETISFNADFFNGKRVVVFDDVLTQGHSYARFACALEQLGAEVLGGYFLGKTISYN
ncbi:phosphoribosyltransferase family protein [uncultured Bacteroides sp.]|uniref:phosphoribosyltransferase n=1 Tax=uncultured Bacteroides sp. TaxID=162156 RepID=UPI00261CC845|nr:phosphoribosyltransferase family protein [uncultured Bacteroides sp.]